MRPTLSTARGGVPGLRFEVASAFAPVSPLGSAPKVDFLRFRTLPPFCELEVSLKFISLVMGGKGSVFVRVAMF